MNNSTSSSFGGLSTGAFIGIIVGVIVLFLVIVLVAWYISTRNWFNRTKVKIDESRSSIDVALTKRYDTLTKSLATVKGYAKHEYETITKTIELRNGYRVQDLTMKQKSELAAVLDNAQRQISLVAEQYPDLKASENFSRLQLQIQDCEENLQASRRIFNSNISIYNQKVVSFPSTIVAHMMHITKEEFFEADSVKKEDVKIEF